MIKAIIFDCFGVLVTEAWTAFKDQHFGHDNKLLEQVNAIGKQADAGLMSHEEAVRQTAALAGVTPQEVAATMHNNVPNELLFEYIRELKKSYKIGLLSNAAANWLEKMFEPAQLAVFDGINLSFESGFVKPDKRAYENAAAKLQVAPEACILVDDREIQLEGARKAGMKTVLYQDFEQTKAELEKLLATDSKS